MKRFLITIVTVCAMASPAYATVLSIGDAYYLGSVNDGIPSSPAAEANYINSLIQLAAGAGDTDCVLATNETCNRVNSTLAGPFPTATATGALKVDTSTNTGINTTGWTYILAKYDQDQAGSLVWFINGSVTLADIPSHYNDKGLSHYTLFNPGDTPPNGVPEPGTLGLLGLGLVGMGLTRRRKKV